MQSTRIFLAGLAATLTAAHAASQEIERVPVVSISVAERAQPAAHQDDRSVEEIIGLIERLEVGMGALEEIGARDTMQHVAEIVQRLRNSRDGVRRYYQEREGRRAREGARERERERERTDLDELEFRIGILQHARHAYAEKDDEKHVRYLDRVLRVAHLQAEGAGTAQMAKAMEEVSMGNVIELLARASNIWKEFGHEGKAELCAELAEYYAAASRREGSEREQDAHEEGADEGRKALARRVKVLGLAHDAHAEAGHPDRADMLERAAHIGHLVLEGVGEMELARATEGFSTDALVGPLRSAAELYREWGKPERAHACAELAQYYHARNTGAEEGERDRPRTDREQSERRALEERKAAERREMALRRLEELHERLDHLQEQMAEMRQALEETTRALRGRK